MSEHKCPKCEFKSLKSCNTRRHFLRFHGHENDQCGDIAEKTVVAAEKTVVSAEKTVVSAEKTVVENKKSPDYICNKCSKIFSRNYNLLVHLETCKGKKDALKCDYCSREFTNTANKSHHMKVCKEKIANEQKQLTINNITNNNNITNIETQNNIQNNNINITNHIQLNNFGHENVSYLSQEFLNNCYNLGPKSIKNIMFGIYFDENHPENHTVKLISLKNEYVNVHTDGDWHPTYINEAIDIMKQVSTDTLIKTKIDEINEILKKSHISDTENKNIDKLLLIQNVSEKIEKEIEKNVKVKLIAKRRKDLLN